jgi:hypothetical protein
VGERGANFSMTPEVAREFEAAGASKALIDSIGRRASPAAAPAAAPANAPLPAPETPAAAAGPRPTPNITSIRDMWWRR